MRDAGHEAGDALEAGAPNVVERRRHDGDLRVGIAGGIPCDIFSAGAGLAKATPCEDEPRAPVALRGYLV
jgi:hypothetical protein